MNAAAIDPRAATRRKRLALAGVATLAATLWAALQGDDAAPVGPAPSAILRGSAPASPSRSSLPSQGAATSTPMGSWPNPPDAESRSAWQPPAPQGVVAWSGPPPPPPPPPPPAETANTVKPEPVAPPFPYTLIGRLDDGQAHALLSGPLRSFGVQAKEVIDGQWRVDEVSQAGLSLTWLPGSLKKNLTFPAP